MKKGIITFLSILSICFSNENNLVINQSNGNNNISNLIVKDDTKITITQNNITTEINNSEKTNVLKPKKAKE